MAIVDTTPAVPEPLPSDEQRRIPKPSEKWTDDYALSVVKSDWAYAESYRVNAHDWRYRNADELYLAWAGQNYWEGTRVPRSSLGLYVVFEQVEAMLPKIVSAVTASDGFHFTADQPDDSDEGELSVQAWRELVLGQLDETRFREQIRRAAKSIAVYGNGVIEVGFEEYTDEYINFEKQSRVTKFSPMMHPTAGPMLVPSERKDTFKRNVRPDTKKRPYVRYVSVKDFYVDPNLETQNLQDAGYVIKRVYMRAEQIAALRGQDGFNIPSDEYLTQLSKAKSTANQDVTKLSTELFRYNMWNPALDYTADPSQKRIAVVEYTKNDRKVWWLHGGDGTESVIYNKSNQYACINFFSAPYADVPDRWHGLSVSDVAEGEQRLQQAIINARVDELALALHPPTLKRRGITVPWYQLKRAPGRVVEVDNPEGDIKEAEIKNITQQAFVEVDASANRVQRITGITDLAAIGTPSSGGNSANRTATGVSTQVGATQDRMRYLVENVEDLLVEPVVNAVVKFDRKFLDLKTVANWLKIDPRFKNLDPEKVMNTRITVECRSSIKMAAKTAFLQQFPLLMQTYLNPEFLQLMAKTNQKSLDADAVEKTLWDAMSYQPRSPWFVKMTDEQIKAMNQPPAEAMMKMQAQQAQVQSDSETNKRNLGVKLIDTLMKKGFDLHGKYAELDDKHLQAMVESFIASKQADAQPAGGAGADSGEGE
jgi:hypothetical protein